MICRVRRQTFRPAKIFPTALVTLRALLAKAGRPQADRDADLNTKASASIPVDLHRIADYLNESDLTRFAFGNLLASPAAIIYAGGRPVRIRTILSAPPEGARRPHRLLDTYKPSALAPQLPLY